MRTWWRRGRRGPRCSTWSSRAGRSSTGPVRRRTPRTSASATARIVEIGERRRVGAPRCIDADGALVTPGWVDVHTHYDGQVTWDDALEPSASNGVTTLVMGNCGVGFAPVRPADHDALIDLMEGVEDIPGSALSVGMPWGEWETFGEYLDVLDAPPVRRRHGRPDRPRRRALLRDGRARRGQRGRHRRGPRRHGRGRERGAWPPAPSASPPRGRSGTGRSRAGPVPGTFAPRRRAAGLRPALSAQPATACSRPSWPGPSAPSTASAASRPSPSTSCRCSAAASRASGRPVTFTVAQLFEDPDHWRLVLDAAAEANRDGADAPAPDHPPVGHHHDQPRRVPPVHGATDLPQDRRTSRWPSGSPRCGAPRCGGPSWPRRAAAERPAATSRRSSSSCSTRPCRSPSPSATRSTTSRASTSRCWARATAAGIDPVEHMYDLLLADEGRAFYALLGSNFVDGTLDVCREMLLDPNTVTGLGDAGAHVNLISDCSASTFHLTHWARDRTAGERLPRRAAGPQAERRQRRPLRLRRPRHASRSASGPTSTSSTSSGCASCPPELRHDLPTGVEPDPAAGRGLPGHLGRRRGDPTPRRRHRSAARPPGPGGLIGGATLAPSLRCRRQRRKDRHG